MSEKQRLVVGLLLAIALLELSLTSRLAALWRLAFMPHAKTGLPGDQINKPKGGTT